MSENVNAGAQGQQPPPTEPNQMKPFRRLCRNFVDDFKKQQEKRSNLRRANLMGDLDSEEEKVAEEPDLPEYKFPGCKKDTANKAGSDCTCQQDFMRKYMIENLMTLETVCGGIDKLGCNAACKRANESQDCLEFFLMITKLEAMLDALNVEVNVKKKENSNDLEGTTTLRDIEGGFVAQQYYVQELDPHATARGHVVFRTSTGSEIAMCKNFLSLLLGGSKKDVDKDGNVVKKNKNKKRKANGATDAKVQTTKVDTNWEIIFKDFVNNNAESWHAKWYAQYRYAWLNMLVVKDVVEYLKTKCTDGKRWNFPSNASADEEAFAYAHVWKFKNSDENSGTMLFKTQKTYTGYLRDLVPNILKKTTIAGSELTYKNWKALDDGKAIIIWEVVENKAFKHGSDKGFNYHRANGGVFGFPDYEETLGTIWKKFVSNIGINATATNVIVGTNTFNQMAERLDNIVAYGNDEKTVLLLAMEDAGLEKAIKDWMKGKLLADVKALVPKPNDVFDDDKDDDDVEYHISKMRVVVTKHIQTKTSLCLPVPQLDVDIERAKQLCKEDADRHDFVMILPLDPSGLFVMVYQEGVNIKEEEGQDAPGELVYVVYGSYILLPATMPYSSGGLRTSKTGSAHLKLYISRQKGNDDQSIKTGEEHFFFNKGETWDVDGKFMLKWEVSTKKPELADVYGDVEEEDDKANGEMFHNETAALAARHLAMN